MVGFIHSRFCPSIGSLQSVANLFPKIWTRKPQSANRLNAFSLVEPYVYMSVLRRHSTVKYLLSKVGLQNPSKD